MLREDQVTVSERIISLTTLKRASYKTPNSYRFSSVNIFIISVTTVCSNVILLSVLLHSFECISHFLIRLCGEQIQWYERNWVWRLYGN